MKEKVMYNFDWQIEEIPTKKFHQYKQILPIILTFSNCIDRPDMSS